MKLIDEQLITGEEAYTLLWDLTNKTYDYPYYNTGRITPATIIEHLNTDIDSSTYSIK